MRILHAFVCAMNIVELSVDAASSTSERFIVELQGHLELHTGHSFTTDEVNVGELIVFNKVKN